MLGLGEFNMDWDSTRVPRTSEFFFLFGTMVLLVVMMNILIAEVSEAYAGVMAMKEESNDFERANLIYQVEPLLSSEQKLAMCKPNWFLIKAAKNGQIDPKEENPDA